MPLLKLAEHYFYILSRFFRVDSFFRPFRFALCHSSLYQKVKVNIICLCGSLKANYRLGIITDNSKDRFEVVKDEMNLATIFDYFIVSAHIGSRKDSAANFELALTLANTKAEESVFIDNNRSNLAVPTALGFKTIFHDDEKNDVERLMRILVNIGVVLS
ncbi:HAD hydrolase-like protein [Chloroflexi bacterium TSY]|nr:HAD hydrolase-like protein [Chloroflexi bacterium TSY]